MKEQMEQLARQAKEASRALARLPADARNRALLAMADALPKRADELLAANARDLEAGRSLGLSAAMLDRLALNESRLGAMAEGLRQVAGLPDPLGRVLDERVRPNGLRLQKLTTPIGVIVIIYESRPNVTADAAGLCLKSGNATILRGGREAMHSNLLIAARMVAAARAAVPAFPEHAIQAVSTPEREAIPALLALTRFVDLCIPRGGEGLIRAVTECSRVPVIKHYKGVCHVFVDRAADLAMAEEIVFNAKCQRPSTCNAAETLLVDWPVATEFLPRVAQRLWTKDVRLHADTPSRTILQMEGEISAGRLVPVGPDDWSTEYNDYDLNLRVVDGLADGIAHINTHGSGHSDAIVTADEAAARRFLAEVDSATVYWNASTRFTDGHEFGMGAEIGISTDKIRARGPMGLDELCSYKWIGFGTGQVRG